MSIKLKETEVIEVFLHFWVALTPDREKVVASARSIEQLEKKVKRLKNQDAIFTYVPPFDRILSL